MLDNYRPKAYCSATILVLNIFYFLFCYAYVVLEVRVTKHMKVTKYIIDDYM